jgi:hypothetical protein
MKFLNRQMTIWTYSRIAQIDQSNFDLILNSGEMIAQNEEAQSKFILSRYIHILMIMNHDYN